MRVNNQGGTVTSNPPGIYCTNPFSYCDTSADFDMDSSVTLTASPAADYRFDYWSNACSGFGNTCTLIMNDLKFTEAFFITP